MCLRLMPEGIKKTEARSIKSLSDRATLQDVMCYRCCHRGSSQPPKLRSETPGTLMAVKYSYILSGAPLN
jgi:hypothetical protein